MVHKYQCGNSIQYSLAVVIKFHRLCTDSCPKSFHSPGLYKSVEARKQFEDFTIYLYGESKMRGLL